jgi:hypothetical protein
MEKITGSCGTAGRRLAHARRSVGTEATANPRKPSAIGAEDLFLADAVLQAGEVGFEAGRRFLGQAVDHKVSATLGLDHAVALQIAEVLGHLHLGLTQDFLKVANAERPIEEQVQDPESRAIAEALIDLNELHAGR